MSVSRFILTLQQKHFRCWDNAHVCVCFSTHALLPLLTFMENQVKWNGMTFVWHLQNESSVDRVFRDTCPSPFVLWLYPWAFFSRHFDTIGACIIKSTQLGATYLFVSLLPRSSQKPLIYLVHPWIPSNNDTAWHGIWDQYDFVLYITWNMESCVCVCVCWYLAHL